MTSAGNRRLALSPGVVRSQDPPLVSIVTPSYNQGRFLRRTLDSILSQDYPHIEYIVSDGGSTDDSLAILQSYGDRLTWVSEPDRGQSHALNKGFARARGAIHAYVNSDDVLLPGAIATVVDYFQRHPDWDLVYGKAHYIDEDDRITGQYRTSDYSFARLMEECCICQPAAFWRRSIAGRVGPFQENLHYVMDYDYWIRIAQAGGNLRHIPDCLACARMYPANKTMSGRFAMFQEILRTCMARGGYVGYGYYWGLWHYLCHERRHGWPRIFRRWPALFSLLVRLHYKWDHSHRSVWGFCRALGRAVKGGLLGAGRGHSHTKGVQGLWPDNWLEPSCRVSLPPHTTREIHLAGFPPRDMTLTIRQGNQILETFPLKANQHQVIQFQVKTDRDPLLELHFSDYAVDPKRRRLAFRLVAGEW